METRTNQLADYITPVFDGPGKTKPMRTCPAGLQIILHIYYSPATRPMMGTQIDRDMVAEFVSAGLIEHDETECGWRCTPKGSAWVEMLCRTPYPVEKHSWVDPRK